MCSKTYKDFHDLSLHHGWDFWCLSSYYGMVWAQIEEVSIMVESHTVEVSIYKKKKSILINDIN